MTSDQARTVERRKEMRIIEKEYSAILAELSALGEQQQKIIDKINSLERWVKTHRHSVT
jgi:hypothetical protein